MSKQISGLKRVGYSETKEGAITWLVGKIAPDSTINPEVTVTETTDGAISGGSSVAPEIRILSRADFDALEALTAQDTERFWHLEFFDGREYVSRVAFNIMINDSLGMNSRDGVSPIIMTASKFHTQPNLFELKSV